MAVDRRAAVAAEMPAQGAAAQGRRIVVLLRRAARDAELPARHHGIDRAVVARGLAAVLAVAGAQRADGGADFIANGAAQAAAGERGGHGFPFRIVRMERTLALSAGALVARFSTGVVYETEFAHRRGAGAGQQPAAGGQAALGVQARVVPCNTAGPARGPAVLGRGLAIHCGARPRCVSAVFANRGTPAAVEGHRIRHLVRS